MIDDAVRTGDAAAVRDATLDLTETERRQLAEASQRLLREVREAYVQTRGRDRPWPFEGDPMQVLGAAQVFALATISPAQLRKIGRWGLPSDELALDVLTARPSRAREFVDVLAELPPTRWGSEFGLMRALLHATQLDPPAQPGYVLAMIVGLRNKHKRVYDALRADPGLLEHEVWRVFEVEGAGEASLAAFDKYLPDEQGWSWALLQLSAEGALSRDRLLDASLAALRRDFGAFQAGWFSRFHERLQPTREERGLRQRDYLALLSNPIATTVSFAVHALGEAGRVAENAVDHIAPALHARAASTVKAALKLLPTSQRAALLAAEALGQAPRPVQIELLAFLERCPKLDGEVTDVLTAAAVAPALRKRLDQLLPEPVTEPPRPAAFFPDVKEPTGLASPAQSLQELVSLLAQILESAGDPYEIERALDGVSRLCDRNPDTLRQLEPVARRAARLLPNNRRQFVGTSPRADIAALVIAWRSGSAPPSVALNATRGSVLRFLSERVREVAIRAASGRQQPLLSLPTRAGGEIDRDVLTERRALLARLGQQPGKADALQAALRADEVPQCACRFAYGQEQRSYTLQGEKRTYSLFTVRPDPHVESEPSLDRIPELFLAAFSSRTADYASRGTEPTAVRWVATVWPTHREPFYAKGAGELGVNIDWYEARWNLQYFLEPLLLHGEPVGEMACLLLALALGAKEPGQRTLARDVLVHTSSDRRLESAALGRTLARLYDDKIVKATRIAASLSDAARTSSGIAEAIASVLEQLLASLHGPPQPDLGTLLELLLDLLTEQRRALELPEARAYVSAVRGSGKAARLARRLNGDD